MLFEVTPSSWNNNDIDDDDNNNIFIKVLDNNNYNNNNNNSGHELEFIGTGQKLISVSKGIAGCWNTSMKENSEGKTKEICHKIKLGVFQGE
jgi:hypothetical protein